MVARLICILLLLSACGTTAEPSARRTAPSEVDTLGQGPTLRYLVLGDSTAVGEGGDYATGIARATAAHLAKPGRRVELKNLGVSGAQMSDVAEDQLNRIGGFRPDVVLLSVGANDVTHLTSARALERDLRKTLEHLISLNCDVRIVATGVPDMSTPPRIPRLLRGLAGWRTRALNTVFRREMRRYGFELAPIAEETGPLFARDRTLFSEDGFHPSDRGYGTWTAALIPEMNRAMAGETQHCE